MHLLLCFLPKNDQKSARIVLCIEKEIVIIKFIEFYRLFARILL